MSAYNFDIETWNKLKKIEFFSSLVNSFATFLFSIISKIFIRIFLSYFTISSTLDLKLIFLFVIVNACCKF